VRVAFATCWAFPDGAEEDRPAAALLGADFVRWDDPDIDWTVYDRVVIRSTWDYTFHLGAFLSWARGVGAGRLRNTPQLVAFNCDKRYLAELSCRTVPTLYVGPGDRLPQLTGEVVVKPNVSAGARDTGRFSEISHAGALALIEQIRASGRTALVQPHVPSVASEGETALIFIGGEPSHAARKKPILAPDEVAPTIEDGLRVAKAMLDDDLVEAAQATVAQMQMARGLLDEISGRFGMPLYARVDVVNDAGGEPMLLELEVVEPRLFLDLAPGAAERLAAAVAAS
jgi:glutathione synthase/RimK-type ligase-like ATP-grasp enzyme